MSDDWDRAKFRNWLLSELHGRQWIQSDLARAMNRAPGVISRWAHGTRRPKPDDLREMARVFGVSYDAVLEAAGMRPRVRGPLTSIQQEIIDLIPSVDLDFAGRGAAILSQLRTFQVFDLEHRLPPQQSAEPPKSPPP